MIFDVVAPKMIYDYKVAYPNTPHPFTPNDFTTQYEIAEGFYFEHLYKGTGRTICSVNLALSFDNLQYYIQAVKITYRTNRDSYMQYTFDGKTLTTPFTKTDEYKTITVSLKDYLGTCRFFEICTPSNTIEAGDYLIIKKLEILYQKS